jgi:hypothetical protein
MVGERLSSREKGHEGREELLKPGLETLGEEGNKDIAIAAEIEKAAETETALGTGTAFTIKSIDFCPG